MSEEVFVPMVPQIYPRLKREEEVQWVERFLTSGLSLRSFAAEHGLAYWRLHRWVGRKRRAEQRQLESSTSFTELKLAGSPFAAESAEPWLVELRRADGLVLRLRQEVSSALVEQLLKPC